MPPQAVLLAAGDASRLLPLTLRRPKTMLLAGGKPILQYAVEALAQVGVEDLVVVTGHNGEKIQAFLGDGAPFGVHVEYAHQAGPYGSAFALRAAASHIKDDAFLVVPANLYVSADTLRPLVKAKRPTLVLGTAVRDHQQAVPTVAGERLSGMALDRPVPGSTRVSTGICRVDQAFLDTLAGDAADEGTLDLALGLHAASHPIHTADAKGPWEAVIDAWDLLRLNEKILDGLPKGEKRPKVAHATGQIHVGDNTDISPTASLIGPVSIGDGCSIGDRTVVGPYVSIRNNTVIGSHCEVRRSILNNNVVLDSRAVLRGSILDDGVQVGPGFLCEETSTPQGPVGCILGADAALGAGCRAESGAVLDPEAEVAAGGVLKARGPMKQARGGRTAEP